MIEIASHERGTVLVNARYIEAVQDMGDKRRIYLRPDAALSSSYDTDESLSSLTERLSFART